MFLKVRTSTISNEKKIIYQIGQAEEKDLGLPFDSWGGGECGYMFFCEKRLFSWVPLCQTFYIRSIWLESKVCKIHK